MSPQVLADLIVGARAQLDAESPDGVAVLEQGERSGVLAFNPTIADEQTIVACIMANARPVPTGPTDRG